MTPQWFVGIVLLESSSSGKDHDALFEEEIVLVSAATLDEAQDKVLQRARAGITTYPNAAGEEITWKLRQVVDARRRQLDLLPAFQRHRIV